VAREVKDNCKVESKVGHKKKKQFLGNE